MNTPTKTTAPVNWGEVESYYKTCRSYKQTAAHFGVKEETVRSRCRRGRWAEHSAPGTEHPVEHPTGENEHSVEHSAPEHEDPAEHAAGQIEHSPEHPVFKSEHSAVDNEHRYGFPALPCLPNLTAHEMTFRKPWEVSVITHSMLRDKEAYRAYIQRPTTQDCLVSGVLGEIPSRRVGRENPPARMLAVIADYDIPLSYDKREAMLARLSIRPNFISTSYSGGTHAVWFFERPLPLPHTVNARDRLLATIRKKLKLDRAFGALDAGAFERLSQVYHAGWDWRMVNESPIPEESSLVWLMDAIAKDAPAAELPLSIVAAEMERRYPGRWQGDFTEGARGVRFWDDRADNHTAAIVTPTGMLCFTGPPAHS